LDVEGGKWICWMKEDISSNIFILIKVRIKIKIRQMCNRTQKSVVI